MSLISRFALLYVPSLGLVALLPVQLRRSMTRAQVQGGAGDWITWSWELESWPGIVEHWRYIRSDGQLEATLIGAAATTMIAAAWLALGAASVWWMLSRRARTR